MGVDVFKKRRLSLLLLLLLIYLLCACRQTEPSLKTTSEYHANVATIWFELQLKLIKETPGFTPPVASRALGYSGVTLYESVVGGMPQNKSLVNQLNGLTSLPQPESGKAYHWAACANSAMATILRDLYKPTSQQNLAAIDVLEQRYAKQYKAEAGEEVFKRSSEFGRKMAEAIFEWSKTDGGHEAYLKNFPDSYESPKGPGLWVPTPPKYQAIPMQPYWGNNRPFVLKSSDVGAPPPPSEYSEDPSSEFYAEEMEVYTTVRNLTQEQRDIALFWADDAGKSYTPPGHFTSIATQVLGWKNADLSIAAETYARLGMSLADAFISCWNTKYTYNLIRPISYIQAVIDPAWNNPKVTDPVITPPMPEYTSGHSVQSGAAAAVLTALFGDDYSFTDNTHTDSDLPARKFSSFFDAADEAALSRLYGGIHCRSAIEQGIEQGKSIGAKVNALELEK